MAGSQSRKYLLTQNNPDKHGLSRKTILEIIASLNPDYYCLADEIGAEGTYHVHIFIYRKSPIKFKTIKNRFPAAHIESCLGSCEDSRAYVTKTGKWEGSEKSTTTVPGTFEEFGSMPTAKEEKQSTSQAILAAIEEGKNTAEIVREYPSFGMQAKNIDVLRDAILEEKFGSKNRTVTVIYLYGGTMQDRMQYVHDQHDSSDIFSVMDYQNGAVRFDGYCGNRVLVFEEFLSSVDPEKMNRYLAGFPISLPARYANRRACYDTVYITSDVPLEAQYAYPHSDKREQERRKEFISHVDKTIFIKGDGEIIEKDLHAD